MDKIYDQQDKEDIISVLNGNSDAFSRIVCRYTRALYNLSFRMLGSSDDAEEAVQEIFLLLFQKLNKYNSNKRFYSWMFTVALNYLRSLLRKSKNKKTDQEYDENIHIGKNEYFQKTPEDDYINQEAEKAVQKALMLLPVKYRSVFILRDIEELSVKETSDVLNIPENSVKTLSRRGKEKLKKNLLLSDWI